MIVLQQEANVPGALFEDKPQSANDAWRKLHSDPLLMIRQREQEALAKIKNNPVKMAMIRKSVSLSFVSDLEMLMLAIFYVLWFFFVSVLLFFTLLSHTLALGTVWIAYFGLMKNNLSK